MLHVLTIGDLHFGANATLYDELRTGLLTYLEKLSAKVSKNSDELLICILGDTFDRKLSMNDQLAQQALLFMDDVIRAKGNDVTPVRLIKGTQTHDHDMWKVFAPYARRPDFKVFDTVTVEDWNDYSFLYVPEEYPKDYKEYYKEYLDSANVPDGVAYDFIFMHGTMNFAAYYNQVMDSESPLASAPVFDYKELRTKAFGGVVSGHIHSPVDHTGKVKNVIKNSPGKHALVCYTGSYSRWRYGEEHTKGFRHCKYNPETLECSSTLVENRDAPLYETLELKLVPEWDQHRLLNEIRDVVGSRPRAKVFLNGETNGEMIRSVRAYIGSLLPQQRIDIKFTLEEEEPVPDASKERIKDMMDKEPVHVIVHEYLTMRAKEGDVIPSPEDILDIITPETDGTAS